MNREENNLVGFILLGILFFLLFYRGAPKKSKKSQKKGENSENLVPYFVGWQGKNEALEKENRQEKRVFFENDQIRIAFSSLGGGIESVQLKKYKKYNGSPFMVVSPQSGAMNWHIPCADGETLHTHNLHFESSRVEHESEEEIIFRHQKGKQTITIRYLLPKSGHQIKVAVSASGLDSKQSIPFTWRRLIQNEEKYKSLAQRKSYVQYQSPWGRLYWYRKKEQKGLKMRWIAFHTMHFHVGITSPDHRLSGHMMIEDGGREKMETLKQTWVHLDKGNTLHFYLGPTDYQFFQGFAPGYEKNHYMGTFFARPLVRYLMLPLVNGLDYLLGSYLLALLFLLLLLALLRFFFLYKNYVEGIKKKAIQPYIDAALAGKKAPNPNEKMLFEMQFYRKGGHRPFFALLFPLFMIFLLFIAMPFTSYAIQFRQISLWWIADLSSYDDYFRLPFKIPLIRQEINTIAFFATGISISSDFFLKTTPQSEEVKAPNTLRFLPFLMILVFNNRSAAWWVYLFFSSGLDTIAKIFLHFFVNKEKIEAKTIEKMEAPDQKEEGNHIPRAQARINKKLAKKNEQKS